MTGSSSSSSSSSSAPAPAPRSQPPTASTGTIPPLRSALKSNDEDDRTSTLTGSSKAVSIADPPVTPLNVDNDESLQQSAKKFSARQSLRGFRRSSRSASQSSRSPALTAASPSMDGVPLPPEPQTTASHNTESTSQGRGFGMPNYHAERILGQVTEWLKHESAKAQARKEKYRHHFHYPLHNHSHQHHAGHGQDNQLDKEPDKQRPAEAAKDGKTGPDDSGDDDVAFHRLQRIIEDGMSALGLSSMMHMELPRPLLQRSSSSKKKTPQAPGRKSSRRAYTQDDVTPEETVPSCDAVLDNTKTMSYTMGRAGASTTSLVQTPLETPTPAEKDGFSYLGPSGPLSKSSKKLTREERERRAWINFKMEIIRLSHTLRLKGWRLVPLDDEEAADSIEVSRLSGALTNAVYVVTPPENLLLGPSRTDSMSSATNVQAGSSLKPSENSKKLPQKLLLRVYGPQVEHLIDRESELAILRRLAKKKIGPRLLGTFTNGRFEQYLNASPLTASSMRQSHMSIRIARRMRELHDGMELKESERIAGPAVWKNWDKWLEIVDRRMNYIDQHVKQGQGRAVGWKGPGFVCGFEWSMVRALIESYKNTIKEYYQKKGLDLADCLVFAHNDTQYGNILQVHPEDEKSPLLEPSNVHKQLVVIDFEYAAANTRGLEFANHFTEWTYDYHDEVRPYACNHKRYPTKEEQKRFIRAYVDHKPMFSSAPTTPLHKPQPGGGSSEPSTPAHQPADKRSHGPSSIVEFMLDARVPPGGWKEQEKRNDESRETDVMEMMEETRLWRLANSAQWVAWGVVQAKIKGFVDEDDDDKLDENEVDHNGRGSADNDQGDDHDATPTGDNVTKQLGHCGVNGSRRDRNEQKDEDETDVEIIETGATAGQAIEKEEVSTTMAAAVGQEDDDDEDGDDDGEGEGDFDYLAYAHERAMFLLGDCVEMGLLKMEDVPENIRGDLKIVEY